MTEVSSSDSMLSPQVHVIECLSEDTPVLIRRAIGFAGRLAMDAGASVYTDAGLFAAEKQSMQTFLLAGKGSPQAAPGAATITLELAAPGAGGLNSSRPSVLVQAMHGPDHAQTDATDLTIQARAGICELIGEPTREPLKLGGHQAAFSTGYAAYVALCSVLLKWQRFGQVERAQVDALSVLSWVNWKSMLLGAAGRTLTREGVMAEWPMLPCADGHVAMVYGENDWGKLVDLIDDPALRDESFLTYKSRQSYRSQTQQLIARWLAPRTKRELSQLFRDAGLPATAVTTTHDLLTDPLLTHRQAFVAFTGDDGKTAVRPRAPHRITCIDADVSPSAEKRLAPDEPSLPLAGIRVLDLGIITAGAGTSALLADMGAQVMKVESWTYPDQFRYWGGETDKDAPVFRQTNRNKQGLALDLKTPEGRQQFLSLVSQCDIVLENFRRGVIERLGIGFNELVKANPTILLASLTGQGLTGPGSQNASFGSAIEARSGIASLTGYADELPVISGRNLNYPDQITCLYAGAAILSALYRQQIQPGAIHLDISQRDLAVFTVGNQIIEASVDDSHIAGPQGNDEPEFASQAVMRTADDRWLAVSIRPERVESLCRTLSIESVAQVNRWIAGKTLEESCKTLGALGVACAPVQNGPQVFSDPLVIAGPAIGRTPADELAKGFPFQFDETPMRITRESPAIGEHNQQILHLSGEGRR